VAKFRRHRSGTAGPVEDQPPGAHAAVLDQLYDKALARGT